MMHDHEVLRRLAVEVYRYLPGIALSWLAAVVVLSALVTLGLLAWDARRGAS